MPFTLSHPAAVLPLLRRPFVPLALVAGAVAPDLPYFVNLPVTAHTWYEPLLNATFTHSLKGMLLAGVPSVVLLVLLCRFLAPPLKDLLPVTVGYTGGGAKAPRGRLSSAFWFLLSALIGLATHVLWDGITHGNSPMVAALPLLQTELVSGLTANRFLQHASTVLGALTLVLWCVLGVRSGKLSLARASVSPARRTRRLAITLGIVLVSTMLALSSVLIMRAAQGPLGLELALTEFLKSVIPTAILALTVYSLCWYLLRWARKPGAPAQAVQD